VHPPQGQPGTKLPFFPSWVVSDCSLQPGQTRKQKWDRINSVGWGWGTRSCRAFLARNISFYSAFYYSYQCPNPTFLPSPPEKTDLMSAIFKAQFFFTYSTPLPSWVQSLFFPPPSSLVAAFNLSVACFLPPEPGPLEQALPLPRGIVMELL
jgi:hypothetical protein